MEQVVSSLMSVAIFLAIVYALVKATLAPIHQKLDRLIALAEAAHNSEERV